MNKLRKKYNRYRALKNICYFLGYPLLIALVFLGSMAFITGDAFKDTWYYGLIIVVIAWVVVTILQLFFSLFCKNKQGRAMISLILSLVVVIGGAYALDILGTKEIKKAQDANAEYNVQIKDYNYQVQYFDPLTSNKSGLVDNYNDEIDRFCELYNVNLKSSCKGDENGDGSAITAPVKSKNPLVVDYDKDVYTSPNGMYADGYIFGVKQAVDILITYNEIQAEYKAKDKDADTELAVAINTAYASSEWQAYTQTADYKAAYGTEGTAYDHCLTMVQLNALLSIVGRDLNKTLDDLGVIGGLLPSTITGLLNANLSIPTLVEAVNTLTIEDALDLLFMVVAIDDEVKDVAYEAIMPVLEYISNAGTTLDFTTLANFKNSLNAMTVRGLLTSLDYTKLKGVLDSFGMDISNYESLFAYGITVPFVEQLLNTLSLTNPIFNYQSPTTKPIFEFIKDETLKKYAYANYYARIHGSNVGSVLIGDNIGKVVMGGSGYPASKGFTLDELYQLRADMSYSAKIYPAMAARRYMYLLGGVIAIMIALSYHNSRKQDEIFEIIKVGGAR
ncbi:MAG: hypothetical protein WCR54_02345 [Clostridia bacterium]